MIAVSKLAFDEVHQKSATIANDWISSNLTPGVLYDLHQSGGRYIRIQQLDLEAAQWEETICADGGMNITLRLPVRNIGGIQNLPICVAVCAIAGAVMHELIHTYQIVEDKAAYNKFAITQEGWRQRKISEFGPHIGQWELSPEDWHDNYYCGLEIDSHAAQVATERLLSGGHAGVAETRINKRLGPLLNTSPHGQAYGQLVQAYADQWK